MSLTGSILDYLPDYVPKSDIKIDATQEFEYRSSSTPKTVYKIEDGPVKRIDELVAIVSGSSREFIVGEEIELRDTTGDAQYDSVAFIDSDVLPDEDTEFEATYVAEPVISRYVSSFDDDIDILGDLIDDSIDSKYLESAEGRELDRIGSQYGAIGRRLGRKDDEYRSFLRSIVETFDATGTKSGIRFVTGAVLEIDPDLVEIKEDFDSQEFSVRVEHPESQVQTTSLNALIDLSSPPGVGISNPPTLYLERQVGIRGKQPDIANSINTVGIRGKQPLLDKSSSQLSLTSTISDFEQKTQIGFDTAGFEPVSTADGLGSSSINSDRTLGSQLTTMLGNTTLGMSTSGSEIIDRNDGLSSSELDTGDTYN